MSETFINGTDPPPRGGGSVLLDGVPHPRELPPQKHGKTTKKHTSRRGRGLRGPGGGGALHNMYCIICMCRARDPGIFNPKFPFRSISFSQMTKIFRSRASPFLVERQILLFVLPLRRPPFSKLPFKPFIAALGQPVVLCSQTRPLHPWATHAHFHNTVSRSRDPPPYLYKVSSMQSVQY